MNILFVLYGGVETNSFTPLALFAKELHKRGYECAAVLHGLIEPWSDSSMRLLKPQEILENPSICFSNGKKADVIHAWTPRQNVCEFVLRYQTRYPTPLLIYCEDNEGWISESLIQETGKKLWEVTEAALRKMPACLSHPYDYKYFLGLADAITVILPQLKIDVPDWIFSEVVMLGVDLNYFYPRPSSSALKKKYGITDEQKIIVYSGGVNQFTAPGIGALCETVTLLNESGISCQLLRSGVGALALISRIKEKHLAFVSELGVLPRSEIPELMALADVFIQPGIVNPFEDLRLPSKIPEFMAMGIPTILPNCNIASLITPRKDALIHHSGEPKEMASLCLEIFNNAALTASLQLGARRFAERYFDIRQKVDQLEKVYRSTSEEYTINQSEDFWKHHTSEQLLINLFLDRINHLLEIKNRVTHQQQVEKSACLIDLMRSFNQRLDARDREVDKLNAEISEIKNQKFFKWVKFLGLIRCQ